MVVFHSMGGLGNQLFQYATARRLAHALGVEVVVDSAWHERTFRNTTRRPFELTRLRVQLRELSEKESRWARIARNRALSRLPFATPWTIRRERSFSYDESIMGAADRTYLYGYWQSPRYFEDIRALLSAEVQPAEPVSSADRDVLDRMSRCESVLVHVRRGDYVSLKTAAAAHGTCTREYYGAAFDLVSRAVRDPVLFVFSDDPDWSRKNLSFRAPTVFVDHNSAGAGPQDLRLMAACRHAIIANSTFSWWGAWLGRGDGRIVVAPKRWFADDRPTPDLLPSSWTAI